MINLASAFKIRQATPWNPTPVEAAIESYMGESTLTLLCECSKLLHHLNARPYSPGYDYYDDEAQLRGYDESRLNDLSIELCNRELGGC